jgi:uncharacterized protein (TIGR00661 family)
VRTNGENKTIPKDEIRILIAPLDWGLGHTTRCIPIIYALIKGGASVWLAGNRSTETILKKEFPDLPFIPLNGYNIRYSATKILFFTKLISQLPHIRKTIQYEQNWLKKVVKKYEIDGVISDNRFGLYHASLPVIYITHQLHIETGNSWLNKIAQKINYGYINRFSQCWVPDGEAPHNLAGKLSHPGKMPLVTVNYLGVISRFVKQSRPVVNDLLIILSGPEPQRSIFEKKILEQLREYKGKVILVRGLPLEATAGMESENIEVFNHVNATALAEMIQESALVLARAGYTTIMDLAVLQQKAILVPTPGQVEQEYLARHLHAQGVFYTCNQKDFNLNKAVAEAKVFYTRLPAAQAIFNEAIITSWLKEVQAAKASK